MTLGERKKMPFRLFQREGNKDSEEVAAAKLQGLAKKTGEALPHAGNLDQQKAIMKDRVVVALSTIPNTELTGYATGFREAVREANHFVIEGRRRYGEPSIDQWEQWERFLPDRTNRENPNKYVFVQLQLTESSRDHARLQKELAAMQQPEFLYDKLAQEGQLPLGIAEAFDRLFLESQLQQAAQSETPELRAARLLSFLESGISATRLLAIAQGRERFPHNYVVRLVEAALAGEEYQRIEPANKQSNNAKRKKIISVVAAALSATTVLLGLGKVVETVASSLPPNISIVNTPSGGVEITTPDGKTINLPPPTSQQPNNPNGPTPPRSPGSSSSPEGNQGPSSSSSQNPDSSTTDRPVNNSPEDLSNASKIIIWSIKGLNGQSTAGYYETMAYSYWDPETQSWQSGIAPDFSSLPVADVTYMLQSSRDDVQFQGVFDLYAGEVIPIPVSPGLVLNPASLNFDANGVPFKYQILSDGNNDGVYFIKITDAPVFQYGSPKVTVSFSLGEVTSGNTQPYDNATIETLYGNKIVPLDKLPQDVQQFMAAIKNLPDEQKALAIQEYIKATFQYSLDPQWTDYYHNGSSDDFFYRLFTNKRGDCDVVNSGLAALLIDAGIPTRFVTGYIHGGGDNITASEGHGWVQAYVNGKWITLDATPPSADDYTNNALQHNGEPTPDAAFKEAVKIFEVNLLDTPWEFKGFAILELINVASWIYTAARRQGHQELADELQGMLQDAARTYMGEDGDEIIMVALSDPTQDYILENEPEYGNWWRAVVLPYGFLGAVQDARRRMRLAHMPTITPLTAQGEITQGEFNSSVLHEPNAESNLHSKEFRATQREFRGQVIGSLTKLLLEGRSYTRTRDDIFKLVGEIDVNRNPEELEREVTNHIRTIVQNGNPSLEKRNIDAFNQQINTLFQTLYAWKLWQVMVRQQRERES